MYMQFSAVPNSPDVQSDYREPWFILTSLPFTDPKLWRIFLGEDESLLRLFVAFLDYKQFILTKGYLEIGLFQKTKDVSVTLNIDTMYI